MITFDKKGNAYKNNEKLKERHGFIYDNNNKIVAYNNKIVAYNDDIREVPFSVFDDIKNIIYLYLTNVRNHIDFTSFTRIRCITLSGFEGNLTEYPDTVEYFSIQSWDLKHFHIKKKFKKIKINKM